jgi:hypothetical protein
LLQTDGFCATTELPIRTGATSPDVSVTTPTCGLTTLTCLALIQLNDFCDAFCGGSTSSQPGCSLHSRTTTTRSPWVSSLVA